MLSPIMYPPGPAKPVMYLNSTQRQAQVSLLLPLAASTALRDTCNKCVHVTQTQLQAMQHRSSKHARAIALIGSNGARSKLNVRRDASTGTATVRLVNVEVVLLVV